MSTNKLPQRYGKYILLRKIAMGGMAEIFRAKSVGAEGFEKLMVVKRILPHFTEDEAFVKMFIDEARIASKLQHSNIVQIYDFDSEDDRYYIAMEYVEGCDLKYVVERGAKADKHLSPAQVAWVMMEASKGLHYAHTKEYNGQALNIVHRDVSPHNLMVSYAGEVKLMDFGIAKAAQRSTKTMAGTVKGKCAYMSPEQARGKALDGRSDLFALGIMMWEMLTHKRLFLGDSDFETLSNVLKQEVPVPSSINPDVPPELDEIVLRSLAKNCEERQPTVEAFGRELTKWFYSNVDDLDTVALKPYLAELFGEDIKHLKTEYEEERQMQAQATSASQAAVPARAPSAPAPAPASIDDDPHGAETIHDGALTKEQLDEALAKVSPDGATVALPAIGSSPPVDATAAVGMHHTSTGAVAASTGSFEAQGGTSKGMLFGLAALILLGIGGAAAFFMGQGDDGTSSASVASGDNAAPDDNATKTQAAQGNIALIVKLTPYDAALEADGKPVEAGKVTGLSKGQTVRLVARADGYARLEELIKVTEADQVAHLTLKKANADNVTITLAPTDETAKVSVDGIELGVGTVSYNGKAGSKIVVQAIGAGGSKVLKELTINPDSKLIPIEMATPAAVQGPAEVTIQVEPDDARVKSNVGQISTVDGKRVLTGVQIGQSVKLTGRKLGYDRSTEEFRVTHAKQEVSLKLRKEVPGFGTLRINAKPWAKVTVKGQSKGTTPVTLKNIPTGGYSIKLTKGSKTVTKHAQVKSNKTKSVFHDFTK
ncbi:MAG: protein kinase domain-containing protein [Myxococcota bacterium]